MGHVLLLLLLLVAAVQAGPIRSRCIVRLTSGSEDQLPPDNEACIVFTTFAMVTMDIDATNKRRPVRWRATLSTTVYWACVLDPVLLPRLQSAANEKKLRALQSRTWGLMIVDETHQLVAKTYKQVLKFAPAHCHLGLTATVRESTVHARARVCVCACLIWRDAGCVCDVWIAAGA